MDVTSALEKPSLADVLPHAEPMILLSDYDVPEDCDSVTAYVEIDGNAPFYESDIGGVPSCVALEYMAQTMALATGLKRMRNKLLPQVGFILGSRRLEIDVPCFLSGSRYRIEVSCTYNDDSFGSFDCKIFDESGCDVARGLLTAFQPEDDALSENLEKFK